MGTNLSHDFLFLSTILSLLESGSKGDHVSILQDMADQCNVLVSHHRDQLALALSLGDRGVADQSKDLTFELQNFLSCLVIQKVG